MTQAMPNENSPGDDAPVTRTTIEVDQAVWRQLRSAAVAEGKNVSTKLEEVLADHFNVDLDDTDTK